MRLKQLPDLNRIDEVNIRLIRTVRMNQLLTQYESKKKKNTKTKKERKPKEINIDNLSNEEKFLLIQKMRDMMAEKKYTS